MAITINTKSFKLFRNTPDAYTYAGPTNSASVVDVLVTQRVAAKPGKGGDLGNTRPAVKRQKTVVVNATTGATKIASLNLSGSLPVGMTDADILDMLADLVAAAGLTQGKDVFSKADIDLDA